MITNEIAPLRLGYMPKILPLVYDDSLSYYETLCKLQAKINEVIEVFNTDMSDLVEEAIEKYFNTLMIDAIYDEPTERITLLKQVVADGQHVYDVDNTAMIIK